ncbi:MAG: hypothetical protein KGR46_06895 [Verrucomicrobia bacterium]|nr:hypothetical protein [Verrucomicrobiota bacterium]
MNPALAQNTENTESNPIHIRKLLQLGLLVFTAAGIALAYVYVKMHQHTLGKEIRITEQRVKEVRAENEVLLAEITKMTSPRELRRLVAEGSIQLVEIRADSIARLTPPEQATEDGILRTAFIEKPTQ